ncbi:ATP-binding protein [Candidatus Symbiobacter mobilis]|uniref:histidine kinase n=1 Tax=Candidatus Symbiobacter mobilis CR TaxID=946483 RepID=U5N4X8_9BURK|nr:ATP-binding protein [Candidatus Symbiobacter mobilis]AGX86561.1 signal transduction histidine kinase [Candidatus Symbiobacter mobilis CR]
MNGLSQLVLDHCPELLLVVDPDTSGIVMVNHAVVQALGYSTEHLLSMPITDIECSLQDVFFWDDVRAGNYPEIHNQEGQYRTADGELLTVAKTVHLLQHEGKTLLLMMGVTREQSVQQMQDTLAQTLSQLRATLESTGNGILVLDWHGKINGMNRQFSNLWKLPDTLLQVQDDAGVLEFIATSVEDSETLRARLHAIVDHTDTTDTLHHKDGRVFELTSHPQFLEEQIIGRVFSVQDITQRTLDAQALLESRNRLEERVMARTADLHRLNESLRQEKERLAVLVKELEAAQNQLLQSERMASIGQLAAGVAHEINNPVGFVNSNLGSLEHYVANLLRLLSAYEQIEEQLPPHCAQQIRAVKQEIDFEFMCDDITALLTESLDGLKRVTRIVQDLKNFSHVDESEQQLSDIEAGIDSTLRVVWNELKYKAEVAKEFAGIPKITCYPFQLNQVFMNLLVNASHAIDGKGKITIRTGFDDQQIWIAVQDTGKGILPEHLPRIFDPFFTTKPVGKGTGLGLSLSYGIVKKHQGHIEVQSTPGEGTTFTVYLPRTPPS